MTKAEIGNVGDIIAIAINTAMGDNPQGRLWLRNAADRLVLELIVPVEASHPGMCNFLMCSFMRNADVQVDEVIKLLRQTAPNINVDDDGIKKLIFR